MEPDEVSPRLDVKMASAGEWCWYIPCEPDTTSAVQVGEEWRVYHETLVELLNSHDIEWSGSKIHAIGPPSADCMATETERAAAMALCHTAPFEIEIDLGAETSHGDDGTWVQVWVLIDDQDEANPAEESYWPGDADHATRPTPGITSENKEDTTE